MCASSNLLDFCCAERVVSPIVSCIALTRSASVAAVNPMTPLDVNPIFFFPGCRSRSGCRIFVPAEASTCECRSTQGGKNPPGSNLTPLRHRHQGRHPRRGSCCTNAYNNIEQKHNAQAPFMSALWQTQTLHGDACTRRRACDNGGCLIGRFGLLACMHACAIHASTLPGFNDFMTCCNNTNQTMTMAKPRW